MYRITGAIFDLDGTLIDSMFVWAECYSMVLSRYFQVTYADLDKAMAEKLDTAPVTIGIPMLCEYFHSSIDPQIILNAIDDYFYQFYHFEVQLKDGVRELLEHLHQKGVKMCVASASSPESVRAALAHCKIDSYFDTVLTCDEIGKSKEHTDIYESALARLQTPKESTWVFEDAVIAIRTSHRMGLPIVGIYDAGQKEQEEIQSLSTVYLAKGESHTALIPYFD